jgi:hypothetical protein
MPQQMLLALEPPTGGHPNRATKSSVSALGAARPVDLPAQRSELRSSRRPGGERTSVTPPSMEQSDAIRGAAKRSARPTIHPRTHPSTMAHLIAQTRSDATSFLFFAGLVAATFFV